MKVIVLMSVSLYILGSESFIIPDELPSILSVIYSNIPTIKKGTDSRLGWGFRLGDRADFQVLVELGPQTNTQPLANQGDGGNSKRNTLENLADTLYAQRQQEKKERLNQKLKTQPIVPPPEGNSKGAEWLKTWSGTVNQYQENEALPLKPKPGLAIGEIDAKSVIPDDTELLINTKKLNKLESKKVAEQIVSTSKPKTTSPKEDALDNVDLD